MTGGSAQLRLYRIARRDGLSTEEAAERAGISIGEARLHDKDDAANPPSPECFIPLSAKIGHNSGENIMSSGNIAADQLRLYIERIERIREEKKGCADDERDVFSEAKSNGYFTKEMREILKLRAMNKDDRLEYEAILDTYKSAIGLDSTPLGDWASNRADEVINGLDDHPDPVTIRNAKGGIVFQNKAANAAEKLRDDPAFVNFQKNMEGMDAKGIGVSMRVAGGEPVALNQTAADKLAEAQ